MIVANTSLLPETATWQLTDFRLRHTLGQGSYGRVRLGVHLPSQEVYAVKCLRKAENLRPTRVSHIMNEVRALRLVEHPFIIRLFQTFQDEHHLYMVLEYAPGGELFRHLKKLGRFPNAVARFYAAEVVLALDYLHSQAIIYSDLKPENIMLDAAGHVKLVDFGFALFAGEPSHCIRGTMEYLAPETVESDGRVHTPMVDWWALGCLIYELLVGSPPFTDDYFPDKRAIFDKILIGEVVFPWRRVNQQGKAIIAALMCRDPSKRLGCTGVLDIQRHPWFAGTNWPQMLKRKVPAPCLAEQGGLVDEALEAARANSVRPQPILNVEQQELFKDFGPYDSPTTPALKRSPTTPARPEWLERRRRAAVKRRAPGPPRADSPVAALEPWRVAIISGLRAGDLQRVTRPEAEAEGQDRRHFEPRVPSHRHSLTVEEQAIFNAFGEMSGPPGAESPTTAGPRSPHYGAVAYADSTGSLSSVSTDVVKRDAGRVSPEDLQADDGLDWVYVQGTALVTPAQVCASEYEPWVLIDCPDAPVPSISPSISIEWWVEDLSNLRASDSSTL